MDQIPLGPANLASMSFSSFLYGVFFVLFVSSTRLMIQRHRQLTADRDGIAPIYKTPLFIGGLSFFVTVSANCVMVVYRSFMAFVRYHNGETPDLYYGLMMPSEVVKVAFWFGTLITGDAIIIYRLWVIWDRNVYVIIFPVVFFIGSIFTCVVIVYRLARFLLGVNIFYIGIDSWVAGDWVLTMCTNLYCSVFIAWRLWRMNRRVVSLGVQYTMNRSLGWALAVFIESAALCVAWAILFLLAAKVGGNTLFFVEDAWPPVSGIAFMLINIRVGMGSTMHAQSSTSRLERTDGGASAVLPLAINITRVVDCDAEQGMNKSIVAPVRMGAAHSTTSGYDVTGCRLSRRYSR